MGVSANRKFAGSYAEDPMCGRIALYTPPSRLARLLDASLDEELESEGGPSWNVAPSQTMLALVEPRPDDSAASSEAAGRVLRAFRWGLVPYWAGDPSIGNRMINARAETVASKGAFSSALSRRRCLVVADGFYEWQRDPVNPKRKVPYYFVRADGLPLTLAGLWERWQPPDRPEALLLSCTVITTSAGPDIEFVHDRMPVVVEAPDFDRWLSRAERDPEAVLPLLRPAPAGTLRSHPVSSLVNSPRNDSPELIVEVEAPPPEEPVPTLFD